MSQFSLLLVASMAVAPLPEDRDVIGPFRISARREQAQKVTNSRHEYSITMGGTVDMENSTTRRYDTFEVAFQPNISLEIANTGSITVVNPRVVINNRGRWWSIEELLKEILAGAKTDQEKALLIWDFVRKHRHHDAPLFVDDELHDPVRMLTTYGGGLCDDSGYVGCSLLFHAGLNAKSQGKNPRIRHLHGHMMCEAFIGGEYQFLDIDEDAFYLERENERLVGGDVLARDHDLAKREHAFGPVFQGWDAGARAAALFGSDDEYSFRAVAGHRIDLSLRPGERVLYRWDNVGKYANHQTQRRSFWGNSKLVFEPRLELEPAAHGAKTTHQIGRIPGATPGLAGLSNDAHLVYEIASPHVLCGGRVRARFHGRDDKDRFVIAFSRDGQNWQQVFLKTGSGPVACDARIDDLLRPDQRPPKYRYSLRIELASNTSGSAQLLDFAIETDLMTSPHFLPCLGIGTNKVEYTDDTAGPHEVTITHHWRESGNVRPPAPPSEPILPKPNATVQQSLVPFRWPGSKEAVRYRIQVSRRPDMRLVYRTSFDLVIDRPEHCSPFTGMFSPDTDYYWRVRCQNEHGVWGPWSDVWQFRWDGPRVPVNVESEIRPGGQILIRWQPNSRGPRPAAYEVYGCDERGFSIRKQPYGLPGLGRQPANVLGRTSATQMLVVAPTLSHPNHNRSFYRVVAIDERGTESGPSDYVELPHPFIYSAPSATAQVGKPFRHQLRTLRSIGDLQHRYREPTQQYWEREEYEYKLLEGPAWLQLDAATGVLAGVPGQGASGSVAVVVMATRRYPYEVSPRDKSGPVFHKTGERFQASHRHELRLTVTAN